MNKIALLFTSLLIAVAINAQTTLDAPTVGSATRLTLTGFTANWTAVANAASYSVNVYDGSNNLVAGSPKTVTGATANSLAITGILSPNTSYTYTVTAVGDGVNYSNSAPSANSVSFTTATSGSFMLQYTDADALLLNADLKGGAAEIYELTTSGGTYKLSTSLSAGIVVPRSFILRGQSGLAQRPIITYDYSGTSGSPTVLQTTISGSSIAFYNLELDGLNKNTTTTGATQATFLTFSGIAAYGNLTINNCKFHDFLNAAGNGVFRHEGPSSTDGSIKSTINIQNSTFDNCNGRLIHLYQVYQTGNTNLRYGDITIRNCTFSNITATSSNANSIVFFRSATQKAIGTNLIFDHCTVANYNSVAGTNVIHPQSQVSGGPVTMTGTISITNCVFDKGTGTIMTIGNPLSTNTIISNSWVNGFSTVPVTTAATTSVGALTVSNSFSASPTPTYTNSANKDFSLSNLNSFICADGFVAGNTYGAVLSALTSPTSVNDATAISSSAFDAGWSAVSGATGYIVNVYNGTTLVNSTRVGNTTTATISGLSENTAYTYKIIAIGDGINYSSSAESAASNSFSTSISTGVNNPNVTQIIRISDKTIITSSVGHLEVFDMQGIRLINTTINNSVTTHLSKGLYIARFKNSSNTVTIQKIRLN